VELYTAEIVVATREARERTTRRAASEAARGTTTPTSASLSRWQNVFLCDFDGPRRERKILVTIVGRQRAVTRARSDWACSAPMEGSMTLV
jgi:hypothetical protein